MTEIIVVKQEFTMPAQRKQRRIMQEFVIKEISAVDRPAQAPAIARVIKQGEQTLTYVTPAEIAAAEAPAAKRDEPAPTVARDLAAADAPSAPSAEPVRARPRPINFDAAVREIATRDRITNLAAMQKARRDYPDLLAAYQANESVEKISREPFMTLVAKHQEEFGTTAMEAMVACRRLHKAAFYAYQNEDRAASSQPVAKRTPRATAVAKFERIVDEIAARDRVEKDEAMRRARRAHPDEFAAYQAA